MHISWLYLNNGHLNSIILLLPAEWIFHFTYLLILLVCEHPLLYLVRMSSLEVIVMHH
jgi:uncharacterized membrane protein